MVLSRDGRRFSVDDQWRDRLCRIVASDGGCHAGTVAEIDNVLENAIAGGAGSAVNECLAAHDVQISVLNLGLPDRFIQHGGRGDMLREAGLDSDGILSAVDMFRAKRENAAAQA